MRYRKLGNSELTISEVSFGCMSLESEAIAKELIHYAIDKGVNYFDTADLYQSGENEVMLGKSIKGIRNDLIIATKVGNQLRKDHSGWDWNPSKKYIIEAVEKSLLRLQTDYIDLYQLHGGTIDDPIDETIDAFETLKKSGKIRYYGISSIRPNVIKEYVKRSNITSVMMQYSLLDRRPEEECLDLLLKKNIGVLTRGTVAKGLLAGKPVKAYLEHDEAQVASAVAILNQISKGGKTMCQSAINYVLAHPAITSAVLGARSKDQLKECLQYDNDQNLSVEDMLVLKNGVTQNRYTAHK
ncbi:oxidoreductase [Aquimarina aggregata]|uniref:Oxidoreductase n=1 Tax=Aquimarina aggregata TaxID=1642818 RepID=A0A162WP85_9FLAO|nr:aldo/keto reductase [Aquimarina aggregata]KZS38219.1 oxidoreductase [Aquimarina aggregata]